MRLKSAPRLIDSSWLAFRLVAPTAGVPSVDNLLLLSAGVPVVPSVDNVLECALTCAADAIGHPTRLAVTHRLDSATEGVVVLGKDVRVARS